MSTESNPTPDVLDDDFLEVPPDLRWAFEGYEDESNEETPKGDLPDDGLPDDGTSMDVGRSWPLTPGEDERAYMERVWPGVYDMFVDDEEDAPGDSAGPAPPTEPYTSQPLPRLRDAGTVDRAASGDEVAYEPPRRGEGPQWEDSRRVGTPHHMAMKAAQGAAELRSYMARNLAEGEIGVDQEPFRRYRTGFKVLADRWTTEWNSLRPGASWHRLDGSAPGSAEVLAAEEALSEVMGWGYDGDASRGRHAVRSRVSAIRGVFGWSGLGGLGQAVVDQYALALVHRDAVLMGLASATAGVPKSQGPAGTTPSRPAAASKAAALKAPGPEDLVQMLQAFEADVRGGSGPSEAAYVAREWRRRADRAEVGVKGAARLIRHARKAGLVP